MAEKKLLKILKIDKRFPGVHALNNVSLEVKKGEVLGIVGENGAGKSTLINVLAGVIQKDSGQIFFNGELVKIQSQKQANLMGISVVYQERSLLNNLNVAENIFAGRQHVKILGHIDRRKLNRETSILLEKVKLDVKPNVIVGMLPPAQQQMVEIAKALSLSVKLLILDEPTSAITENETEVLFNIIRELKKQGVSIIFISHRLSEVFKIADRIAVLKDGRHMGMLEKEKTDINEIVRLMVGRELISEKKVNFAKDEKVLEVKKLNSMRFSNINFYLKKGEILTFAGLAGAGRTEIMRAIFGIDKAASGDIYVRGKKVQIKDPAGAISAGLGLLPEDRKEQALFLGMSVKANIAMGNLDKFGNFFMKDKKIEKISNEYKNRLNIITPDINRKTLNLSGGNQQKVVLARWLLLNPPILIADEPTRGVDVGSRSEIYKILKDLVSKGTSLIVISSDLTEVLAISNRIIVMHSGRIAGELGIGEATEEKIVHLASGNKA